MEVYTQPITIYSTIAIYTVYCTSNHLADQPHTLYNFFHKYNIIVIIATTIIIIIIKFLLLLLLLLYITFILGYTYNYTHYRNNFSIIYNSVIEQHRQHVYT